jgi:hypothetical protein
MIPKDSLSSQMQGKPDHFRHEIRYACFMSGQMNEGAFANHCCDDLAFDGFASGAAHVHKRAASRHPMFYFRHGKFWHDPKPGAIFPRAVRPFDVAEHDDYLEQMALEIRAFMSPYKPDEIMIRVNAISDLVRARLVYIDEVGV